MQGQIFEVLKQAQAVLPVIAFVLVGLLIVGVLVIMILNLVDYRRLLKRRFVFIEITPPAFSDKTPEATQRLFSVLHGLGARHTWRDGLMRRKNSYSLEVVSSKKDGIRYIVRAAADDLSTVQQNITSYLPDVKVRVIDDYLPQQLDGRLHEFRPTGHFALPLMPQEASEQHDPIAYLAGQMSKLDDKDLIVFQLVLVPTEVQEASNIASKVLINDDILYQLSHRKSRGLPKIFDGINNLLFGILDIISSITSTSSKQSYSASQRAVQNKQEVAQRLKPLRTLTTFEQLLVESINEKVRQPLFRAEIRVFIASSNKQRIKQRIDAIRASLAVFSVPKYQSLKLHSALFSRLISFKFKNRLPSFFESRSSILSTREVADLYHFPSVGNAIDDLATSYSRTLATPLSLKQADSFDVVLGVSNHHNDSTLIGMNEDERQRHMFAIGGTGNGKTTLLKSPILQDIIAGRGVGVVDPHGDLAEFIVRNIPKEREKDVVYFNPDDIDYPIGINLLEVDHTLKGGERLKAESRTISVIVEALRKVFSDDGSGGHRIESILRNGLLTAMTIENATLFTVLKLLRNSTYRKKVVDKLEDEQLKEFWNDEFGKAGDMQRVSMAKGVTTKLDRFASDPVVSRIFGQKKSTINFNDILDGKILICNLSKGKIGPDNSELLGTTILSLIQLAAEARSRIKEEDRKPFYLYVDEFQNFATLGFAQIVAEARKYKLFLTMAEQTTSQQEDGHILGTILANVGTVVCFRTGNPADEKILLPFFGNFLKPGEINNLPAFNFYARMASVNSQAPLSGETIMVEDEGNDETMQRVIEASRNNYAVKYSAMTRPEPPEAPPNTKSTSNINPTTEPH